MQITFNFIKQHENITTVYVDKHFVYFCTKKKTVLWSLNSKLCHVNTNYEVFMKGIWVFTNSSEQIQTSICPYINKYEFRRKKSFNRLM